MTEVWIVMDPRGCPTDVADTFDRAVGITSHDSYRGAWEEDAKEGWTCIRMVPAREADELRAALAVCRDLIRRRTPHTLSCPATTGDAQCCCGLDASLAAKEAPRG